MHIFVVYAHPSKESFTHEVQEAFLRGITDAGHTYAVSDLYAMDFVTDLDEQSYLREANYREDLPICEDIFNEQQKINEADGICFVYPVFWTEAPAKLVGWFQRVWTVGYAYGNRTMPLLKKALFLCVAGRTMGHLEEHGQLSAMQSVMIGDRFFERAEQSEMIVLDAMTKWDEAARQANWQRHLGTAYEAGKHFFEHV